MSTTVAPTNGRVNEDGEILPPCPTCEDKERVLRRAENRIRGLELQIAQLKEDRAKSARNHTRWHEVEALFDEWKRHCKHPNSRLSADRFYLALPFLEGHGEDLCRRAIAGAAYDAYETKRKNGTTKRHDDWELIHRSQGKFEEFCNRAPKGWKP